MKDVFNDSLYIPYSLLAVWVVSSLCVGDDGKAQDSAAQTEGVVEDGKETHGKETGIEEDVVVLRNTKENASEQTSEKDFVVKEKKLWELHRLLNNRKDSLNSTYKKNADADANNKVFDLNQRTMATLDLLAEM